MSFAYPSLAFMVLPVLAVAAWAGHRQLRWRRQRLESFGQPEQLAAVSSLVPRRRQEVQVALWSGAIGLLILALARPQLGERPASLAQKGRDVLVLLDLSRSMNAGDVGASRLEASKQLVKELSAGSAGSRFGLVVFGGSAFLQLPLTSDHAAFGRFLDAATTDDLANPGTDLSRALSAAATTFEHEGQRGFQTAVLVSDGESVEGDAGPAIRRLRDAGDPRLCGRRGNEGRRTNPGRHGGRTGEVASRPHRPGGTVSPRGWRPPPGRSGDQRRLPASGGQGSGRSWRPSWRSWRSEPWLRAPRRERADRFQWPLGLAVLMLGLEPLLASRRRRPK